MLLTKTIKVKWHNSNIDYYTMHGYKFTKIRDEFEVKIKDLNKNSNYIVEVLCDYCNEIIIKKTYQNYNKSKEKSVVQKDCCINCRSLKVKESNLINYGVESTNQIKEIRDKQKETCIKKYGGISCTCDERIKTKVAETNMNKFGTKAPAQNNQIKEKMKQTNIKKYGSISPSSNSEIRNKQIQTSIEKYGVPYSFLNAEVRAKGINSLYKNKTAPTSRQQTYINSLIGGELNFPHNNLMLDIAYPKEKIYVEIDLGGHKLRVKLGQMTEEELEIYERNRWYALYRSGWREIRIISEKDKIPSDDKIFEMINFARNYLNGDRHYIRFYLDDGMVKTSQFEQSYDFGNLRYIYKKDTIASGL